MRMIEMDDRIESIIKSVLIEPEIEVIDEFYKGDSDPMEFMYDTLRLAIGLEKVAKAFRSTIPILEELANGAMPIGMVKVNRKTISVDMDALKLCHPDVVKELIEDGKYKISTSDLKKYDVDDVLSESVSTYYKMM